ncbi:MAG TPA: peptide ABC transporter substrate-binding protein [Herpetosiphonaceae bacterium]
MNTSYSRVRWSVVLLLALVLPILAACGAPQSGTTASPAASPSTAASAAPESPAASASTAPAPSASAEASPSSEASASAAPAGSGTRGAGGTLRLLWWQAPTILNFHLGQGTKDSDASRLILEPLAAIGPDGLPVPILAAEVPTVENGGVSQDLTTVTWKLKEGVKWSDGSDFTADDVAFTYSYCADEKTACTTSTAFAGVKSVEAVDPTTVKITWEAPNPNPYQMFVSTNGEILQKKQFENCVGEKASTDSACQAANNAPIGTGPYKLREFRSGDSVTYDINENYRDPNKPFFKEVQMKGGGDATSAARAVFQTGDTDYAWNLQVEAPVLAQLQGGGQGDFLTIPGSSVERISLNRSNPSADLGDKRGEPDQPHPFLSDLKVRQALGMAIDRAAVAALYPPGAGPTCEIITTAPYVDPSQLYGGIHKCEQDIEGAKKLLDEAGWTVGSDGIREKDGVKMNILYQTTVNPLRQKEQALVKANWEAIGVAVELKSVDPGVFFSTDAGNPDTFGHFYADVQMYTNNYEQPDPTNYLCGWTTEQIAQRSNQWQLNNNERYSNPEYDALCQQLRTETDEAKRKELVLQMNNVVVEDVVVIPLVARPQVASGKSKKLQGVELTPWDTELWNVADWTMSE